MIKDLKLTTRNIEKLILSSSFIQATQSEQFSNTSERISIKIHSLVTPFGDGLNSFKRLDVCVKGEKTDRPVVWIISCPWCRPVSYIAHKSQLAERAVSWRSKIDLRNVGNDCDRGLNACCSTSIAAQWFESFWVLYMILKAHGRGWVL